jgi:hypothetical protein
MIRAGLLSLSRSAEITTLVSITSLNIREGHFLALERR